MGCLLMPNLIILNVLLSNELKFLSASVIVKWWVVQWIYSGTFEVLLGVSGLVGTFPTIFVKWHLYLLKIGHSPTMLHSGFLLMQH